MNSTLSPLRRWDGPDGQAHGSTVGQDARQTVPCCSYILDEIAMMDDTIEEQRIVIYVGPQKTASTSIQKFFITYASNDFPKTRAAAFKNWSYPMFLNNTNGEGLRYFHKRLENLQLDENNLQSIQGTIHRSKQVSPHLFLAWEGFSNFEQNGALAMILHMTACEMPELIVNYRAPRVDQWISWWKQFTRKSQESFYDYACFHRDPLPSRVMDPLNLVATLRSYGWRTNLIDMGGVAKAGLDISHTIACQVLRVPCDNGWVKTLEQQPVRQNTREGDSKLTASQLEAMEKLLRQHDCKFRYLQHDPGLNILYQDSLWKKCLNDEDVSESSSDFSDLLSALRAIIGCTSNEISNIHSSSSSEASGAHHIDVSFQTIIGSHTNASFEASVLRTSNVSTTTESQGSLPNRSMNPGPLHGFALPWFCGVVLPWFCMVLFFYLLLRRHQYPHFERRSCVGKSQPVKTYNLFPPCPPS